MATYRPIVFRLVLIGALLSFVLESPCGCAVQTPRPGSACCSAQPDASCCSTNEEGSATCGGCGSRPAPANGSQVCCAPDGVDCKQADAASWNPETQVSKHASPDVLATHALSVSEPGGTHVEPATDLHWISPSSDRPIYLTTHLLRV